jgi:hypothetical protein
MNVMTHPGVTGILVPPAYEEYLDEYRRLWHDDRCDCDGEGECQLQHCGCPVGWVCPCGCGQVIDCPSRELCRHRILHLTGAEQTRAVKAWMKLGLCVCMFVLKREYVRMGNPTGPISLVEEVSPIRNWRAERRRKLIQCPCGAYFDNATVRLMGLRSESEWKRVGFGKFLDRSDLYYIDHQTAAWRSPCWVLVLPDGSRRPLTHRRYGPKPKARVWRPFWDSQSKRFKTGLWSVDLFSADQIDPSKYLLTIEQCLKGLEGTK